MLKLLQSFLLLFVLCVFTSQAGAQTRQQYTGSNIILLGFESNEGIIEFGSDNLQVRYIQQTQQIECRLPVSSLYPLHDEVPADMAYDVMFGSKYPELVFYIDAPDEIINGPMLSQEAELTRATVEFQGTPNETKVPVMFASDRGVIVLSTSFDLRMSHFRATLPAKYLPLLTGRILIKIRNARWLNNPE